MTTVKVWLVTKYKAGPRLPRYLLVEQTTYKIDHESQTMEVAALTQPSQTFYLDLVHEEVQEHRRHWIMHSVPQDGGYRSLMHLLANYGMLELEGRL